MFLNKWMVRGIHAEKNKYNPVSVNKISLIWKSEAILLCIEKSEKKRSNKIVLMLLHKVMEIMAEQSLQELGKHLLLIEMLLLLSVSYVPKLRKGETKSKAASYSWNINSGTELQLDNEMGSNTFKKWASMKKVQ